MWKQMLRLIGACVALVGFGILSVGMGGVAAADVGVPLPPVSENYDQYPLGLGIVPAGCTAQGAELLVGEQFSVNGGAPVDDMRSLNVSAGDLVSMTWDSLAPGCEDALVSLSLKAATSSSFDPSSDQYGLDSVSCGTGVQPCAQVDNTLSLTVGVPEAMSCYQLDAHLGPALAVVGPGGAYYGAMNGQHNVLISAKNTGLEPCTPPECVAYGYTGSAVDMETARTGCIEVCQLDMTAAAICTELLSSPPASPTTPATPETPGDGSTTGVDRTPTAPATPVANGSGSSSGSISGGTATGTGSGSDAGTGSQTTGVTVLDASVSRSLPSTGSGLTMPLTWAGIAMIAFGALLVFVIGTRRPVRAER